MPNNKTHIRFFHAVPNAPAVDVYMDNNLVVEGLRYSNFIPYFHVKPGEYTIYVYASGTSENPLIKSDIIIPDNKIFTIALIGLPSSPELFPIEEPKQNLESGKLGLRFANLSPDAPSVNVVLPDGSVLFKDIAYKTVSDYIQISPGKYTIEITPTGTDKVILKVPNINLKPDRFYSIYAIGLVNMQPLLQVVIPLDGNSYIK